MNPAVSVQSDAPDDPLFARDLLSHLKGFPSLGGMIAPEVSENQMCHVSLVPLTWCGLPQGLVGSQLLDATQIRRSSAGSGTEARHAQSATKVDENCPSGSISGPSPDAKCPSKVSPCQKSAVRLPTPAVEACLKSVANSKSCEMLARVVARDRGQPAGKEEGSETSDDNGPLPIAEVRTNSSLDNDTPPLAHAGRIT